MHPSSAVCQKLVANCTRWVPIGAWVRMVSGALLLAEVPSRSMFAISGRSMRAVGQARYYPAELLNRLSAATEARLPHCISFRPSGRRGAFFLAAGPSIAQRRQ